MNRLLACLLVAAACCAAFASDDIPPPRLVDVTALVRQLGSDDFHEREAASKRLAELTLAPPPELLAAIQSDNPELRERAAKAAAAIRRNAIARVPLPGAEAAERGDADLFVAGTAKWEIPANSERLWTPPFKLAHEVAVRAGWLWPDRLGKKMADLPSYVSTIEPAFIRTNDAYERKEQKYKGKITTYYPDAVIAPELKTDGGVHNLWVVRGPVTASKKLTLSIVFANGDVTVGESIEYSILVCDGNVEVRRNLRDCIIIARGDIKAGMATFSTLIAGRSVTLAAPQAKQPSAENKITENTTKPLDFITFFELSTVGVEVRVAEKAVVVAAVADGKAFAKAGVKVGDAIAEVNGKRPDSAESLRRLLRDALAIGDATVTLKRGGTTYTVKVALPE